jgi:UDP-2-acetamido-2,6-beta-L-arabino-hexul-4-ose reductase
MKILITGANGFIGRNLKLHLTKKEGLEVSFFTRDNLLDSLEESLRDVDFIFHLAGVNRPVNEDDYLSANVELARALYKAINNQVMAGGGKRPKLVYASSSQAAEGTGKYASSKRIAEKIVFNLNDQLGIPVYIYRLPNVFGKWAKPNYNSVVATFCHNISRDLPIRVDNSDAVIQLLYVEDLMQSFLKLIDGSEINVDKNRFTIVEPIYSATVGQIAFWIREFKNSRLDLTINSVGSGLMRALYSTYISYLPIESFSYYLPRYSDSRGVFVEMLKTQDSGQISYFTAAPGITRGGHYHHTKTEKFLVVKGRALFKFKNLNNGQCCELVISHEESRVVETIPGWAHDVTNIGNDDLIVMLWANEAFDRSRPDTLIYPLSKVL